MKHFGYSRYLVEKDSDNVLSCQLRRYHDHVFAHLDNFQAREIQRPTGISVRSYLHVLKTHSGQSQSGMSC
jgi:hypothetical protein